MSQLLIQKYLNELAKLRQIGGTNRESVVREAFKDLLKAWARSHDLTFIPEDEGAPLCRWRPAAHSARALRLLGGQGRKGRSRC